MRPEQLELIRYRMDRAREAVAEAELLFKAKHLHTAVNRLYYACFYAVSALLLTEEESSSKHSGVRALFDRLWIKTGRLPKKMGRLYRRLFDMRQKSDYADLVTFAAKDVKGWQHEAAAFVERISRAVAEKSSTPRE